MTSTIGKLIVGAFAASRSKYPQRTDDWIAASFRAGGKIPDSAISTSIQHLGDLDLLCRALEDELAAMPPLEGHMDLRPHYLILLSVLWVGSAYAISYAFSDRGLYKGDYDFETVAEDLRIVRVQLEKHQIASDWKLDQPLHLITEHGAPRIFQYDKKDPLKAHIGRFGLSDQRSVVWEAIDVEGNNARWIERRSLADRLLKALMN